MRRGIHADLSSVVRGVLRIAEEEAVKDPDLVRRWAEEASSLERRKPTRLSAIVENGGDALVWEVRAVMSKEFGSARKFSDALEAVLNYVRTLSRTEGGLERLERAAVEATPAEDGRGKRRIFL